MNWNDITQWLSSPTPNWVTLFVGCIAVMAYARSSNADR